MALEVQLVCVWLGAALMVAVCVVLEWRAR